MVLFQKSYFSKQEKTYRKPTFLKLGIVLLVVMFLITLVEYLYYQSNLILSKENAYQELSEVADQKVSSILFWKNERLDDALFLQKQTKLPELMEFLIKNPTNVTVQNEILEQISVLDSVDQYDVIFMNSLGKTLLTFPKNITPLSKTVINQIPISTKTHQITFIDLYQPQGNERINMGILIPMFYEKNAKELIGFIHLGIDPTRYLYPMLQKWPKDSTTAETLLLRKEGSKALVLNELRFQKDSALKLSVPLTDTKTPAVQAVLRRIGYFEGLDYQGKSVVSELRSIPHTDWFMVARMDKSEIFASLYSSQRQLNIWLFVFSILLLAFLFGLFKRNQILFIKDR